MAVNLSLGGLCVQSGTAMPQGAEVTMVLWLPGRRPVRATGRVVWTGPSASSAILAASGVALVEMHPADRALLHDYLGEMAAGAPPAGGH
jgi:uncharacterized protein (TIGR02266 family)